MKYLFEEVLKLFSSAKTWFLFDLMKPAGDLHMIIIIIIIIFIYS